MVSVGLFDHLGPARETLNFMLGYLTYGHLLHGIMSTCLVQGGGTHIPPLLDTSVVRWVRSSLVCVHHPRVFVRSIGAASERCRRSFILAFEVIMPLNSLAMSMGMLSLDD